MRLTILLSLFLLSWFGIKAQNIGINDDGSSPNANAVLDVKSTSKGLLMPRLTTAQKTTLGSSLGSTEAGMIVFDTDLTNFFFWDGSAWKETGKNISTLLKDADANTKIQVEESANEDIIRFDIGGTEKWVMNGNRLESKNTGFSIFIGNNAGLKDDLSNNENVFIGENSGSETITGNANLAMGRGSMQNNTTGSNNISIGNWSLLNNTTGWNSVAIGRGALGNNTIGGGNIAIGREADTYNQTGNNNTILGYQAGYNGSLHHKSGNVFLGYQAGYSETGSNKLYIENSNSSSPLIYGEFDNNLVRINGSLNINNAFSFPLVDGTANQVLTTDGSGALSWANATVDTDDQSLSLSGNTLNISDGTGVDLTSFKDNTDAQDLSLSGNTLSLTNDGTSVDLSGYVNTDAQNLSLSGNTLNIANGTGVDLSSFKDNTDAQTLSISGSNLSVSGGNSVDINAAEIKILQDNDNDTKIQVEETADEDIIRFDAGGTERWRMVFGRIEPKNSGNSVFIGEGAGENDDLSNNENVFLGQTTGNKNTTGYQNAAIGNLTLYNNTAGHHNTVLGYSSSWWNSVGSYNVAIGPQSNDFNQSGNFNTIIGYQAGKGSSPHSKTGNVFLGFQAGFYEHESNKLYIENSDSSSPLIYGEFDNDLLRINGTLNVNNAFSFPTIDGAANQVLTTDGSGTLSWVNASTDTDDQNLSLSGNTLNISDGTGVDLTSFKDNTDAQTLSISGSNLSVSGGNSVDINAAEINILQDNDNNTKIQVEEAVNENIIRFDIDGTEKWVMTGNRLESKNTGFSVFIGNNAGLKDDLSNNENVFIGENSGSETTTGNANLAMGRGSMQNNTTGSNNVALGNWSLLNNTTGWNSVAIGRGALGSNTTGGGNIAIGREADTYNQTGNNNTILGYQAGYNGTLHHKSGNVFLGFQSGYNETGSNKLYIENSNSATPLIYGEFDNNLVKINGTLNVNNAFTFPLTDGTANQVLATDGSGTISWTNVTTDTDDQNLSLSGNTLNIQDGTGVDLTAFKDNTDAQDLSLSGNTLSLTNDGTTVDLAGYLDNTDAQNLSLSGNTLNISGGSGIDLSPVLVGATNTLKDADDDTKIFVEKTADDDSIRFDIGGTESWTFGQKQIVPNNTFGEIYIGKNITPTVVPNFAAISIGKNITSGSIGGIIIGNDIKNPVGTTNIIIGDQALNQATLAGANNVAIGNEVFKNLAGGTENVGVGYAVMPNLSTGDNNVGFGQSALFNLTTGNSNISIGGSTGGGITSGNDNVVIGSSAGPDSDVSNSVFIGANSGKGITSSHRLVIETQLNNTTPLIYGEFDNDLVRINGDLGVTGDLSFGTLTLDDGLNVTGKINTDFVTVDTSMTIGKDGSSGKLLLYDDNPTGFDFSATILPNPDMLHNETFTLPQSGGTNGHVLTTDGTGLMSWQNVNQNLSLSGTDLSVSNGNSVDLSNFHQTLSISGNTLSISNGNNVEINTISTLNDVDLNTRIEVDNSNDDIIRMIVGGTEFFKLQKTGTGIAVIDIPNNGDNVAIGFSSGSSLSGSSTSNTFLGASSGSANVLGDNNTFVGHDAGIVNNTHNNTFIGGNSGRSTTTGQKNTFLGLSSGYSNTSGQNNTYLGSDAGYGNTTNSNNTFVGHAAGSSSTGGGNVFLGYTAGQNETLNNRLYIANSNTTTPLIWGDFTNARLGIGKQAATNNLEVSGTASKTTAGDWLANSDARLKKNITQLKSTDVLNKLLSLKGVTYEWNDDKTGNARPEGIQYGFTAQNIQKVFPTLVTEDNLGYLQTAYGTYDAMYVEAIRALNEKIDENKKMEDEIQKLKEKTKSLEASLKAVQTLQAKIDNMDQRLKETQNKINGQALVKGN